MWATRVLASNTPHPHWFGGVLWKIYGSPSFSYGLDVVNMSNANIMALEKIQKELCRSLLKMPQWCNATVLYGETGIRPVRYNVIQATVKLR